MPEFAGGVVEVWDPDQYPTGSPGRAQTCRFAPGCGAGQRPDHEGCPANPAEFSERIGGDVTQAGGLRYMAICRPRAVRRFGLSAVEQTEVAARASD